MASSASANSPFCICVSICLRRTDFLLALVRNPAGIQGPVPSALLSSQVSSQVSSQSGRIELIHIFQQFPAPVHRHASSQRMRYPWILQEEPWPFPGKAMADGSPGVKGALAGGESIFSIECQSVILTLPRSYGILTIIGQGGKRRRVPEYRWDRKRFVGKPSLF